MDRRRFVAMIGGALAAPLARAQQPAKLRRIGYLVSLVRSQVRAISRRRCRQGMRELGYVEGRNMVLELRCGRQASRTTAGACGGTGARSRSDVIVAAATPANLAAPRRDQIDSDRHGDRGGSGRAAGLVDEPGAPGREHHRLSSLYDGASGQAPGACSPRFVPDSRASRCCDDPDQLQRTLCFQEIEPQRRQGACRLRSMRWMRAIAAEIDRAFAGAATRSVLAAFIVFDDPVLWSHRKQSLR